MKKYKELTILNLIILIMVIACLGSNPARPSPDVNQDGKVTIMDLVVVKREIIGYRDLTAYQRKIADMNQDGVLDADDMAIIKAYIIYE